MTWEEAFEATKKELIDDKLIITSIEEAEHFHELLIKLRTELFMRGIAEVMPHYRGEQNYGWDIRSGIFRPPLNINDPSVGMSLEKSAISEFENVIKNKIGKGVLRDLFYKEKYGKDWDLLFQAQHAGIKTTLTDWTAFIISALYFAVEESQESVIESSDGQLWCFIIPTMNILGHNNLPERNTFYDINPFEMPKTYLINPSYYVSEIEKRIFEYRMFTQKGRFVMLSKEKCNIPLNLQEEFNKYLFRVRVPAKFKNKIRMQLSERGITRGMMYVDENPKYQGLIAEINQKVFTGH